MNIFFILLFFCISTLNFGTAQHANNPLLRSPELDNKDYFEEAAKTKESHIKKRPEAPTYHRHLVLPALVSTLTPSVEDWYNGTVWGNVKETSMKTAGIDSKSSIVARKGVGNETDWMKKTVPGKGVGEPPKSIAKVNESTGLTDSVPFMEKARKVFETSINASTENHPRNITNSSITDVQGKFEVNNSTEVSPVYLSGNSKEDSSEESDEVEHSSVEFVSRNATHINGTQIPNQSESPPVINPSATANSQNPFDVSLVTSVPPPEMMTLPIFDSDASVDNVSNASHPIETTDTTKTVSLSNASSASAEPPLSTPLGKPSTASMDDIDTLAQRSSSAAIIVAILIVVTVCALVGFIAYRRLRVYWNRRHYSRVDFLIDGLYEM